jgi:hypothetical protein
MKTVILVLEIELSKPMEQLADIAAQRIYMLDAVEDVKVIAQGEKHVDIADTAANHRLG